MCLNVCCSVAFVLGLLPQGCWNSRRKYINGQRGLGRLFPSGHRAASGAVQPCRSRRGLEIRLGVIFLRCRFERARDLAWSTGLLTAFYIWGELQLAIFSHPVDSGSSSGSMEMCLPSQTLLGGQFRLDKADLEETGRAVFVPAQPRHGLYAGAGLALLAHLGFGLAFKFPSWLLLGALGALAGRWFGSLPVPRKLKGRKHVNVWGREGPRLVCRVGELLWIGCCVLELQSCEASSRWLSVCQ